MRATVDLDHPSVDEIRDAWLTLREHGDGRVMGRVSSSGTGVHLKVHGCDPDVAECLRVVCGDDPTRRRYDRESSLKPKQILFGSKKGRSAGEWTDMRHEVIEELLDRAPEEYRRRMILVCYPALTEGIDG